MAGVVGDQPSGLAPSAAGAEQANSVQSAMNFKMPPAAPQQAPPPAQAQAADPLEALADQHAQQAAPAQSQDPLEALANQHVASANSDFDPDKTASVWERMKGGFARDEDKQGMLEQDYGKANVRKNKDGDYEVKDSAQGKWHPFNAKVGFTTDDYSDVPGMGFLSNRNVSGDPANLPGDAPAAVGSVMGEAAAAPLAAGVTVASGGAGGIAAPAILAGGAGIGAGAGTFLKQRVAYNLLGIPKSGNAIDDAQEIIKVGGLTGIFSAAGNAISSIMKGASDIPVAQVAADTHEALEGLGKGMTAQANQAEAQGATAIAQTPFKEQAAKVQLDDAAKLAADAKTAGVDLLPHEMFPNDPKAQHLAEMASTSPALRDASIARGGQLSQAVENLGNSFVPGDVSASEAIKIGSVADRAYGQLIGGYREQLLNSGTKRIDAPEMQKAISDLQDTLGFVKGDNGEFTAPKGSALEDVAIQQNMKPKEVSYMVNRVSELADQLANTSNGMDPKKMDMLYNEMKTIAKNNAPSAMGTPGVFKVAAQLRNAARDDFATGIGSVLTGDDQAGYQAAMSRYSSLKSASDTVKQLFDKDSVSPADVVNYMKSGGTANADRISALKTIVQQENPQGWDAIGKAYYDKMIGEHLVTGGEGQRLGNVDWVRMQKNVQPGTKAGDQLVAIMGQDKADQLTALTNAGAAIQQNMQKLKTRPGLVAGFIKTFGKVTQVDPDIAISVFSADHAARSLMDEATTQKIIQNLSEAQQTGIQNAYNKAMDIVSKKVPVAASLGAQQVSQPQQGPAQPQQ